ncbi:Gfo/Idh/MocA family protein [Marininema halotolerans]|uniref:Predicted dehydrogenase n=1 Tax=Marininema halotolerans TaxID=1155944 RepID=A0A1I6P1A8_9BACL|nr:Gfo/Idh/MocA family oxidoreductase [Marininema halotolerans]SFS33925.1 Predicted dehydrogenase [Marininema halotolerans]
MIRYGIVGCGHIAKKHVEAIQATVDAELIAICDRDNNRLSRWLADGVRGYTDVETMLQESPVDVVCICTPSGTHAALTIQVAQAGRHVIVEKPMALSLADADRMIDVCREQGVNLAVVHPNRFRPAMEVLKKRVNEGAFGTFSHANATVRWNRDQAYFDQDPWRGTKEMDGGVLMNQAIHNLDLLIWMMGEVEEVSSYQATRLRDIEVEDVMVSVLRFRSGALGVIEAAVTLYPKNLEETLSLFGETGTAVVGGPTANWIQSWQFADLSQEEATETIQQITKNPYGKPGHQCLIEDMTTAIKMGRPPMITGEDGRRVLALVNACQQAAATGQPVRLDESIGGIKR